MSAQTDVDAVAGIMVQASANLGTAATALAAALAAGTGGTPVDTAALVAGAQGLVTAVNGITALVPPATAPAAPSAMVPRSAPSTDVFSQPLPPPPPAPPGPQVPTNVPQPDSSPIAPAPSPWDAP